MGGRTDFRLVELSTTALQGLRVLHRHQRSTHPHLDDRPDGSPTGPLTPFFNTLLDDHTDMMSTLLQYDGEALVDPASGAPFDPGARRSWESAIGTGAVNIANYITPLSYSGRRVHFRHLRNGDA